MIKTSSVFNLIPLILLLTACSGESPQTSNTPAIVGTNISVSSSTIGFGLVYVGDTSDTTLTVTNNGTASLTLGSLTAPATPFSRIGGTCTDDMTLAPSESCTVILRYSPTGPGLFNDSFSIPSDDPNIGTGNGQNNTLITLVGITVSATVTASCTPPAPVGATDEILYVNPDVAPVTSGTCSLPGGATPYNSIAAALDAAGPDDVVRLLPGTFNEYVVFETGGTEGHPITLTYTPRTVCTNGGVHTAIIDVQQGGGVSNGNNCIDASYPNIIIDGLEVKNCGYNGIKVDGDANGTPTSYPTDSAYGYYSYGYYAGDSDYYGNIRNYNVNGADNVIIRNNIVHHTGDDGLKIGHTNGIYMLNNEIYRTGIPPGQGQQGIDMVGVYDSVVCGNYIHDEENTDWGPVSMEKGIFDKGGSQNILIENNLIADIQTPQACIENGGDTEWYNTRYDPHLVNAFAGDDFNTDINSQILSQTPDPSGSGYTIGLFHILYEPNYISELMSESRYGVIRGNLLINCDPPLSFRNTYASRAYNNTAINSGSGQRLIKVWEDNEADGDGSIVISNVTYQEATHDNIHLQIYNNLFYNSNPAINPGDNTIVFDRYNISIGAGFILRNNLFYLASGNTLTMGYSGGTISDNIFATDPLINPSNYIPTASSPARNSGLDLTNTPWLPSLGNVVDGGFSDGYGTARPAGGALDIGAFEYVE